MFGEQHERDSKALQLHGSQRQPSDDYAKTGHRFVKDSASATQHAVSFSGRNTNFIIQLFNCGRTENLPGDIRSDLEPALEWLAASRHQTKQLCDWRFTGRWANLHCRFWVVTSHLVRFSGFLAFKILKFTILVIERVQPAFVRRWAPVRSSQLACITEWSTGQRMTWSRGSTCAAYYSMVCDKVEF